MTEKVDIAVLKAEFSNLHESQGKQTELMEKIFSQTKATNGRLTRLEVRHEEEDKLSIPMRIEKLEKWQYKVIGAYTAITMLISGGGWVMVRATLDSHLDTIVKAAREETFRECTSLLDAHKEEVKTKG